MTNGKLWLSCQFINLFQLPLHKSNFLNASLAVSHTPCVMFNKEQSLLWIPYSREPHTYSESWMCLALSSSGLAKTGRGTITPLEHVLKSSTFSTRSFEGNRLEGHNIKNHDNKIDLLSFDVMQDQINDPSFESLQSPFGTAAQFSPLLCCRFLT